MKKTGYKSIALDIAGRIVSGEFPVNSKISGRSILAGKYQVSPETIRKAIGLLKEENIVSVSQGKESDFWRSFLYGSTCRQN
ncbi:GntR family transcriptional regulator [Paenibacillus rhizophilus]|uniref:GntR family transcriptional regulator n=1 Tax=Paenibacillus rhizophilus TaxID=1850366 RepID=UPI001FE635C3|nr:GntR family transcriptional regulator [Paenibacillus rhizophilus]